MKGFILLIFLFSLYICQEEKVENIQKALLIKTNLTKEELAQLLQTQSENNNTSIEEVNPEPESETGKIVTSLKNGKLKIKIKLELDLNKNETKSENEGENIESENNSVQTAFIQTYIPEIPQKISFFKYILALLISLILMSLFALSSHFKKKKKIILNKYTNKKNEDYLLQDN